GICFGTYQLSNFSPSSVASSSTKFGEGDPVFQLEEGSSLVPLARGVNVCGWKVLLLVQYTLLRASMMESGKSNLLYCMVYIVLTIILFTFCRLYAFIS
ncbi:hypothetical protein ACHAXS_003572, partial [Conticribra weissflogii]